MNTSSIYGVNLLLIICISCGTPKKEAPTNNRDNIVRIDTVTTSSNSTNQHPNLTVSDSFIIPTTSLREPKFPGGKDSFKVFFNKQLSKYKNQYDDQKSGTLGIAFDVDTFGRHSNYHVTVDNLLCEECVRISINILSNMPKWEPGLKYIKSGSGAKAIKVKSEGFVFVEWNIQ